MLAQPVSRASSAIPDGLAAQAISPVLDCRLRTKSIALTTTGHIVSANRRSPVTST